MAGDHLTASSANRRGSAIPCAASSGIRIESLLNNKIRYDRNKKQLHCVG